MGSGWRGGAGRARWEFLGDEAPVGSAESFPFPSAFSLRVISMSFRLCAGDALAGGTPAPRAGGMGGELFPFPSACAPGTHWPAGRRPHGREGWVASCFRFLPRCDTRKGNGRHMWRRSGGGRRSGKGGDETVIAT